MGFLKAMLAFQLNAHLASVSAACCPQDLLTRRVLPLLSVAMSLAHISTVVPGRGRRSPGPEDGRCGLLGEPGCFFDKGGCPVVFTGGVRAAGSLVPISTGHQSGMRSGRLGSSRHRGTQRGRAAVVGAAPALPGRVTLVLCR